MNDDQSLSEQNALLNQGLNNSILSSSQPGTGRITTASTATTAQPDIMSDDASQSVDESPFFKANDRAGSKSKGIAKDLKSEEELPMYEKKRIEAQKRNKAAMRKLVIVLLTSIVFVGIEITGGIYANSIAIMSDAAHLGSDVFGLGVSVFALHIAMKNANSDYTFGYHRVEVIGALFSIFTIWFMAIWLVYEATMRFYDPPEIMGGIMFGVAILSLVFNVIQIWILHTGDDGHIHGGVPCSGHGHGHDHSHEHEHEHDHEHDHGHSHGHQDIANGHEHHHHHPESDEIIVVEPSDLELSSPATEQAKPKRNLNVEAAYLHVLGDMINSIGVIVAATIIYFFPQYWYVDPICTYFFAFIVIWTTRLTFWNCVRLLLETAPESVDQTQIKKTLLRIEGVADVHDLHVWSLSQEKFCLTIHILVKDTHYQRQQEVLTKADAVIRSKFGINHLAIQIEANEPVEQATSSTHKFRCGNDIHL